MPAEILLLLAAAKGALLIGAALLLVSSARWASAAFRHAVLLAAMIGALLLPLLSATLPNFSPIPIRSRPDAASPELRRWGDQAILLLLVRADAAYSLPPSSSLRARVESQRGAILTIWLLGTAIVLFRILADLAAARRALLRAVLRGRAGPGVPLLESDEIGAPVAVGLFRPAIMIPVLARLETEAFRSVIGHELAHVERRDCLTQLVVRLVCAVYWFNPLAWYAAQRIALERERACDDRVLGAGVDPIGYSQLLIEVARRHARMPVRLHAVSSMALPAHLERRIAGILDASVPRGGMSGWRIAWLAMVATCIVTPLAALGLHDGAPLTSSSDPFLDPQSERVEGVREWDRSAPVDATSPVDGVLIAMLRRAAAREPNAANDLAPDRARWALSLVRAGSIIEPLIGALHDPDWRVRGYAAWALAPSGDPRAVEPLIAMLDHPVWRLRAMAAFALHEIGDPRAADALTKALDDPAWQVRSQAVAYFGALHEPRFRGRIEPLRNDPHIAVRIAADEALSAIP